MSLLQLIVVLAAQAVATWLVLKLTNRGHDRVLREVFREQASDIREMYIPLLEHQAQRDPEIAESCELMVAELRQRERTLTLAAAGKFWSVLRDDRRNRRARP